MTDSLKKLRIFAASPSDVASERAKLETVVDSLKPMADYLGLTLEVIDWRDVVPDTGRPQQIIFDQLKPTSWDIFIGILWHRFGTPPGATDKTGKEYLSGTEEEFKTAYELWKQHGKPRMVLYRCTRALPFDVDPDQLKNVRAFFKLIEDTKGDYPTLYQVFDTTEVFEKLLLDNLQKMLIEYGEQSKTPITAEVVQTLAPKILNNLPRRAAFFGRAKEMDTVMRALSPADRTWGVLVDGIGGIGKSALAIEASYRAQEAGMFDAFVFATAKQNILEPSGIHELNPPARTLNEFLNETARLLGQSDIAKLESDEKRRALVDVLRTMRSLLIYDNLETLSKEEQEAMADFLRELPQGCKAIITSRRRGGEGAVWLRVEKLDWDAARGIIENEIARDIGVASKLHRVGASRWQELFDETHGSPLALVHTLGLIRVRTALTFDSALAMLRGAGRDDDLVKFVYQEARKELTDNDKVALVALSFFAPSAIIEVWMEVANLSRNALETTIDRLSALSLVDVLAGEERYVLHPLTRAFARDELFADANIVHKIGMRFAHYWVDYSKRYGGEGRENYKEYDRLEAEWMNLDATANWLWEIINVQTESVIEKDAGTELNSLATALKNYLTFSGRWDEEAQLSARTYEAMSKIQDWMNAGWRAHDMIMIYYKRARTDDAAFWADLCAKAWARGGSRREQAIALRMRGLVVQQRKDYEQAEELFKNALAIWQDLRLDSDIAIALNELGDLERKRKNYGMGERYYREAFELAKKINDKQRQAYCIGRFGELSLDRERWVEAREWFEKELPLAHEIGRQDLIAQGQYGIARVHEMEGRVDLALSLTQKALKIYERLQHKDLAEVREFVVRLKKASTPSPARSNTLSKKDS